MVMGWGWIKQQVKPRPGAAIGHGIGGRDVGQGGHDDLIARTDIQREEC